jgi:hypothetical protein
MPKIATVGVYEFDAASFIGSPVDLGVNHRCGRVIWMPEQQR